jgi:hypothetical protein
MWSPRPIIALKARQKDARVAKKLLTTAKKISKVSLKRIHLKFDSKYITPATGSVAQREGRDVVADTSVALAT